MSVMYRFQTAFCRLKPSSAIVGSDARSLTAARSSSTRTISAPWKLGQRPNSVGQPD
jgi:hypothetical protein